MSGIPIADIRLRAFVALLAPAFVGHTIQLLSEDVPWSGDAMRRFWITPGWHLSLSPLVPLVIAILLAVAVVAGLGAAAAFQAQKRR